MTLPSPSPSPSILPPFRCSTGVPRYCVHEISSEMCYNNLCLSSYGLWQSSNMGYQVIMSPKILSPWSNQNIPSKLILTFCAAHARKRRALSWFGQNGRRRRRERATKESGAHMREAGRGRGRAAKQWADGGESTCSEYRYIMIILARSLARGRSGFFHRNCRLGVFRAWLARQTGGEADEATESLRRWALGFSWPIRKTIGSGRSTSEVKWRAFNPSRPPSMGERKRKRRQLGNWELGIDRRFL